MPPDIRGCHTIAGVSKRVEFEYDLLGQGHQMVHYTPTLGPTSRWEYPQGDGYASLALPVTNRAARLPVGCLIAAAPRRTFCKGAREEQ